MKTRVVAGVAGVLLLAVAVGVVHERRRLESERIERVASQEDAGSPAEETPLSQSQSAEIPSDETHDTRVKPANVPVTIQSKTHIEENVGDHDINTNQISHSTHDSIEMIDDSNVAPVVNETFTSSDAQRQREFSQCENQVHEISVAAEHWAADHKGLIPANLSELRGQIAPMLLVCPSTHPKTFVQSWGEFDTNEITYRIPIGARGKPWDFRIPNVGSPASMIWLCCPIHKIFASNFLSPVGKATNQPPGGPAQ